VFTTIPASVIFQIFPDRGRGGVSSASAKHQVRLTALPWPTGDRDRPWHFCNTTKKNNFFCN